MTSPNITSLLNEHRSFPPSAEFASAAHVPSMEAYEALYDFARDNPDAFWAERATSLDWYAPWETLLEWDPPHAKWFLGGKINASYNCVDRHLTPERADKPAIIFSAVLLPHPDGPSRLTNSCLPTVRSTRSSASVPLS